MILKWLANFWLRWPRCQKPSPISRAIDGHWCRSVLERWIHFALHGPMDDAQPQGFPEIPENQELLKQRQPARSGEPFMTKRPKKKARAEQGVAMELKRILHNLRFEKGFEIFPKRFNSSISFRSSPSHRTQLRLLKPWLLQSMRSMADPSYQGTLEPIGVVQ